MHTLVLTMLPHRKIILMLTIVLCGGSVISTAYYAHHLGSNAYRLETEAGLTDFFELPSEVGRIRGVTFSSRAFEDVVIYLPDQRDRVFSCKRAVWETRERGGNEYKTLDLDDGMLILGSDRWQREDYKRVLASGLEHDFESLDLETVTMKNFEIAFDRGGLAILCRNASGTIDMRDAQRGVARLQAYEFNGHPVNDGVRIRAVFAPHSGVNVSELELILPEIPLTVTGLGKVVGGNITTGSFAGSVRFVQPSDPEKRQAWISGELTDADLAELTNNVPFGPFKGKFSVGVDSARTEKSLVTDFKGRAEITNLSLHSFAPLFGFKELSGSATLHFDSVDLARGHINRFRLAGWASGMSVQELLQTWGRGSATGMLSVRINNFDVADDKIKSADIEIISTPPKGKKGTIDRALLLGVVEKFFHFNWPSSIPQEVLPDRIEYVEFGMRLLIRDNQMRILGTHGAKNDAILTIQVFGQPIAVVKEQRGAVDLTPHIAAMLEKMRGYDPNRVREWWELKKGSSKP